jgi:predicted RNA-binding Zn-ribbon protein involved in translation (DUF1610 family)
MIFSKIEYPKCPKCGVVINDLSCMPYGVMTTRHGVKFTCPKCGESLYLFSKIELTIEAATEESK